MTRKEEIKRASKSRANQYSHPVEWNECYRHFKEGAEWADSHPVNPWHKVEDELPPKPHENSIFSGAVLITDGKSVNIGYCSYVSKNWYSNNNSIYRITHWAKLPELPKKTEELI